VAALLSWKSLNPANPDSDSIPRNLLYNVLSDFAACWKGAELDENSTINFTIGHSGTDALASYETLRAS
jgi:hypothetical protein